MAFININNATSIVTEVTTIFNGNLDKRYMALRSDRKELSKAVTNFIIEKLIAMTPEDREEDMEVEARLQRRGPGKSVSGHEC